MPIGASAGAAVVGAGATAYGANRAASAQTASVRDSNALQERMFNESRADTAPFRYWGEEAFNTLGPMVGVGGNPLTAPLTRRFEPTIGELENTPGYKFTLDQLLKTTQNSFAGRGLGQSGAAVAGAQDRAFGLASTTYQQQLDNYLKQNSQIFNMLMQPAQLGANAAASQAGVSAQVGANMGNNLIGGGNAVAGAQMAGTNALVGGANNLAGSYMQWQMLNRLTSPTAASGTSWSPATASPNWWGGGGGGGAP